MSWFISNAIPCYISFHEWLIDTDRTRDELVRCTSFIGLEADKINQAIKWIDPTMVHHKYNIEEVNDGEGISTYEELKLKAYKQRDELRYYRNVRKCQAVRKTVRYKYVFLTSI